MRAPALDEPALGVLRRHQVVAFMEDRGIEANAQLLQPVTAIDVFVRLCLNLLNLYRSSVSPPTLPAHSVDCRCIRRCSTLQLLEH